MNKYIWQDYDIEILDDNNIAKQDVIELSEIQAAMQETDFNMRSLIKKLVSVKNDLSAELKSESLGVQREMEINAAIRMVENELQKLRVEGIW